MADSSIATYLKKIANAVYGSEVRDAIYKAIEQCYDDVNSPSLNTEGLKTVVQQFIDDGTMAALTIEDGTITKEKLASDIKFDIEDGEITSAKIADSAITPEKTSFFDWERQENLVTEVVTVANHPVAVVGEGAKAGTTLYFNHDGMNSLQVWDEDSAAWVSDSFGTYGSMSAYTSNSTGSKGQWVLTSDVPKFRCYGSAVWTWESPAINTTGVFFDGVIINGLTKDGKSAVEKHSVEIVEAGLADGTDIIPVEACSFINKNFRPVGTLEWENVNTIDYKLPLEAGKRYYIQSSTILLYPNSNWSTNGGSYTSIKTDQYGGFEVDESGTYFMKLDYSSDYETRKAYAESFTKWIYEEPVGDAYIQHLGEYDFLNMTSPLKKTILELFCPLIGKTWNALGDSNTQYVGGYQSWQNSSGQRGYVQQLGDQYFMSAKNNGTGGATWGTATSSSAYAKVNELVEKGIQWDIVTFSFGTNADTSTGSYESTAEDISTMCGAMRYCIETMQANFPLTKLGVILPTRRSDGNLSNDALKIRCNLMTEIAHDYGVPVCDMFNESGTITSWYSDGLHICNSGSWSMDKPACFHYYSKLEKFLLSL